LADIGFDFRADDERGGCRDSGSNIDVVEAFLVTVG
jgi:hypothetical protein